MLAKKIIGRVNYILWHDQKGSPRDWVQMLLHRNLTGEYITVAGFHYSDSEYIPAKRWHVVGRDKRLPDWWFVTDGWITMNLTGRTLRRRAVV